MSSVFVQAFVFFQWTCRRFNVLSHYFYSAFSRSSQSFLFLIFSPHHFFNTTPLLHSDFHSVAECESCPTTMQILGFMLLGILLILGATVFIIMSTLKDVGQVKKSDSLQKIILNHFQVASFASAFPLLWPPFLKSMFEVQGSISTLGKSLMNPECLLSQGAAAAEFFYAKLAMFMILPFVALFLVYSYWQIHACRRGMSLFAKRSTPKTTTLKDKLILTACTVIYLIYPTLCVQAFQVFHCTSIGEEQYLAADLEEPCWEGRHLVMVFLLGVSQVLLFVVCLPSLIFVLLRRNNIKLADGSSGLSKHVTIVRYGLFYGAYKDETYYWELVITSRKIIIIALSVFGPALGKGEEEEKFCLMLDFVCRVMSFLLFFSHFSFLFSNSGNPSLFFFFLFFSFLFFSLLSFSSLSSQALTDKHKWCWPCCSSASR